MSDNSNVIPGKEVNLSQILHGEQFIEVLADLPTDGRLTSKVSVAEVLDKGSGASIVYNGLLFSPIYHNSCYNCHYYS